MDSRTSRVPDSPSQPADAGGDSTLDHAEAASTPTGVYVPAELAGRIGSLPAV